MDITTIVGILLGFITIIWGMYLVAPLSTYYDLASIVIVVGCTAFCYVTFMPLNKIKYFFTVSKVAFKQKKINLTEIIPILVSFAEKARREGLLALEDDIEDLEDDFLKRGIQLVVDGTDPELVKNIMETQMSYIQDRHAYGQSIFENISTLAPAFGMIGTLIGLVAMLLTMSDPSTIGPSMSTALITTLYGAVIANLFCNPIKAKLEGKSADEILLKKIMLAGMLSIQAGDNPRIVEEKLKAYLPPSIAAMTTKEGSEEKKE
ncbi:MAG TPA: motility protein A [bacterium]|nr:motility protein A [bacterium]